MKPIVWVVGFMAGIAAAIAQEKAVERPDLAGRVVAEDGTPLSDASVFIYTAGPRVGPGPRLPSRC